MWYLVDGICIERPGNLYEQLEKILPQLHIAIFPISSFASYEDKAEWESLRITPTQWGVLAKAIQTAMAGDGVTLFQYHGGADDKADYIAQYRASRAYMLWDDLADIYRDIYEGLALWNLNTAEAQAAAAYKWRFNFECHWGHHLLHAMTTVHEARYWIGLL